MPSVSEQCYLEIAASWTFPGQFGTLAFPKSRLPLRISATQMLGSMCCTMYLHQGYLYRSTTIPHISRTLILWENRYHQISLPLNCYTSYKWSHYSILIRTLQTIFQWLPDSQVWSRDTCHISLRYAISCNSGQALSFSGRPRQSEQSLYASQNLPVACSPEV